MNEYEALMVKSLEAMNEMIAGVRVWREERYLYHKAIIEVLSTSIACGDDDVE